MASFKSFLVALVCACSVQRGSCFSNVLSAIYSCAGKVGSVHIVNEGALVRGSPQGSHLQFLLGVVS